MKIVKISGKFRIVDDNNNPIKTEHGVSLDGGGHLLRGDAIRRIEEQTAKQVVEDANSGELK